MTGFEHTRAHTSTQKNLQQTNKSDIQVIQVNKDREMMI